jgi:hypothetical protein
MAIRTARPRQRFPHLAEVSGTRDLDAAVGQRPRPRWRSPTGEMMPLADASSAQLVARGRKIERRTERRYLVGLRYAVLHQRAVRSCPASS